MAASVLAVLAGTYYFTYEPAFEVTIRWSEGISWDRRVALERRLGLVRGRDQSGRTLTYDLVDTRPDNVRAILELPDIEDGGVLDRRTFSLPPDAPYGEGWMWLGSRLPLLRVNRLVPVIAVGAAAALVWWMRQELRARRGRLRLIECLHRVATLIQDAGHRFSQRGGVGA